MTRTARFDDLTPANLPSNTETVMPPCIDIGDGESFEKCRCVSFGVLAAVALGFGLEQEITIVFNSEGSS